MNKQFETTLDQYVKGLGEVDFSDQRLADHRVYFLKTELEDPDQAIFAIIKKDSLPVLIDLACDRKLSANLREKYESVVPSKIMNEATWNRIICSGQLNEQEVLDLVNLAYQLVKQVVSPNSAS